MSSIVVRRAAVLALISACSEAEPPQSHDSGVALPDVPVQEDAAVEDAAIDGGVLDVATRTIRARGTNFIVTEDGIREEPRDFTLNRYQAYVADPQGGYRIIEGSVLADGTVEVRGVPAGEISFVQTYPNGRKVIVVTTSASIDYSAVRLGENDRPYPEMETPLRIQLTNLAPWQAADELQLYSSDNDVLGWDLTTLATAGVPAFGDTSMDLSLDYFYVYQPLISPGDRTYLYQLSTATAATGLIYKSASRALALPPAFAIEDGRMNVASGAMIEPPETATVTLDWNLERSRTMRAEVHPEARVNGAILSLGALPGAARFGHFASTPDLILIYEPGAVARVGGALSYHRAVPENWDEFWFYSRCFVRNFSLPGTTRAAPIYGCVSSYTLPAEPQVADLNLSPIRNLRINGQDAYLEQPSLGATPLIEWDPPALGSPSYYTLQFVELTNEGGETVSRIRAFLHTASTSIRVPPDVVQRGVYIVRVNALRCATCRPERPFLESLPVDFAAGFSGMVER